MIVLVAIFLLWLLVGLGCGLPGISTLWSKANAQDGLNADNYMESIVMNSVIYIYAVCQIFNTKKRASHSEHSLMKTAIPCTLIGRSGTAAVTSKT
jgi:hypothetical protein